MHTILPRKSQLVLFGFLLIASSCSKSKFASMNTDPDDVLSINLVYELTPGEQAMVNNNTEDFYDFIRNIKPWTQTFVFTTGNPATFLSTGGNINQRWGSFYGGVGDNLEDIIHRIQEMPASQQVQYQNLYAIASIAVAYYAFYTTDPNGSIPYSQAFLARYTTPSLLTPLWDTQETVFDSLDNQLQQAISILETTQSVAQVSVGANDLFYGGNTAQWVKAANSIRLRMAMRLMTKNPTKLTTIANQVLGNKIGLIASPADDFIIYSTTINAGSNNSNPNLQGDYSGEHNVVQFMVQNQDPRLRIIYEQSGINTQALFNEAQAAGVIPDTAKWDNQVYRGQYAVPSYSTNPAMTWQFQQLKFPNADTTAEVYYPSIVQPGLGWFEAYAPAGGTNMFPLITYADVCLMRAELVARGLDNDNVSADSLYSRGVVASLENYDAWGKLSLEPNYTALQPSEITAYLASPGVAFNPATALEQICDQQYLNFFMEPNEIWALIKRTGYPSSTGQVLKLEDVSASGTMPRRYPAFTPSPTDLDYTNEVNALDTMELDPNYGVPSSIYGRVWWDDQP
jgi:hypothetical protein